MNKLSSIELDSGLKVHVRVINPRLLTVQPISAQYEILDENGKLVGIDYNGEYLISQGSILTIGQQKYKINEIRKDSTSSFQGYELFTFRKITTTANFIMPLLGGTRTMWRWNLEFVNAFIGDEAQHDGKQIKLLYRFSGSTSYAEFEDNLKTHPKFVEQTDPDKYTVLYTFDLPEAYADDIKLIMEGKYSYISEKAKARIIDFHSSSRNKPIGQILYRCPARRKKMEEGLGEGFTIPDGVDLLEMFNIQNEIFKEKFTIKNDDATKRTTPPQGFC